MGVKITETVLRDAHQSLIATRMPTDLMLTILDKMDQVGSLILHAKFAKCAWIGTLFLHGM